MNAQPTPFDLIFAALAEERFPAVRQAVGDAPPLDDFLIAGPVVELLHDLRPEEGLGSAVDDFVALVHAVFRHWVDGCPVRILDAARTAALRSGFAATAPTPSGEGDRPVKYIQVAPRMIWARLEEADVHEPLDGWFAVPNGGALRVVACLGVHPSRPGLSVLAAEGERPLLQPRPDGSPPFAPVMEGGDRAGLASVVTTAELLSLGWQAIDD